MAALKVFAKTCLLLRAGITLFLGKGLHLTRLCLRSWKKCFPMSKQLQFNPPFQSKFPKEKFDGIYKLTGKPILICDFAVRFKDGK